jgi:hypothetical protein
MANFSPPPDRSLLAKSTHPVKLESIKPGDYSSSEKPDANKYFHIPRVENVQWKPAEVAKIIREKMQGAKEGGVAARIFSVFGDSQLGGGGITVQQFQHILATKLGMHLKDQDAQHAFNFYDTKRTFNLDDSGLLLILNPSSCLPTP